MAKGKLKLPAQPPLKSRRGGDSLLADPKSVVFNTNLQGSFEELASMLPPQAYLSRHQIRKQRYAANKALLAASCPPRASGDKASPKASQSQTNGKNTSPSPSPIKEPKPQSEEKKAKAKPRQRVTRSFKLTRIKEDQRIDPPKGTEFSAAIVGSRGEAEFTVRECSFEACQGEGFKRFSTLFSWCFPRNTVTTVGECQRRRWSTGLSPNLRYSQTLGMFLPTANFEVRAVETDQWGWGKRSKDDPKGPAGLLVGLGAEGEGEALVASLCFRPLTSATTGERVRLLEVLFLAVAPPFQRLGLGRLLLGSMLDIASAQSDTYDGVVVSSSIETVGFYEESGFKIMPKPSGWTLKMEETQDMIYPLPKPPDQCPLRRATKWMKGRVGLNIEVAGLREVKNFDVDSIDERLTERRRENMRAAKELRLAQQAAEAERVARRERGEMSQDEEEVEDGPAGSPVSESERSASAEGSTSDSEGADTSVDDSDSGSTQ